MLPGVIAIINALISSGAITGFVRLFRNPDNTLSVVQVVSANDAAFKADLAQGDIWEAEIKAKHPAGPAVP